MKIFRSIGFATVIFSVLLTGFATNSSITDVESGQAINVVTTNNVIQVYTYTGASSEAVVTSTFDEGESWLDLPLIPAQSVPRKGVNFPLKTQARTIYSRVNRSTAITVESEYIKTIDACTTSGKHWNFRNDTCIENY